MQIDDLVKHYMSQAQPWIETYGLLAIGAGILCETLLFAGLFVPGFSILVTAGLISARGELNPFAVMGAALLGGFIGDQTAYVLGRAMGDRLFRRHAKAHHRLRYALEHEGGYILLWYHYVSPLRIVMPYIAGSLSYPRMRWMILDTLGLALWIGFAFGLGWVAMGPLKQFGNLGYYVIFGAILGMLVFTIWRIARLLLRRESAAEMFGEEAELAAKVMRKVEKLEETIKSTDAPTPLR